jgi:hypothetical protein
VALWRLGGSTQRLDTEHIAVEAWRIAPQRFAWQNYPDYPNLDTARVALSDAKKAKYGSLVDGNNKSGWLLTSNGLAWARGSEINHSQSTATHSLLRQEHYKALENVKKSAYYLDWQKGRAKIDFSRAADSLDLTADVPRGIVHQRLSALRNGAELVGESELGEFLRWLARGLEHSQ